MKSPNIKQLEPGTQLFVGLTYERNSVMSNHLVLWEKTTNVPKDQYLVSKMQQEFTDSFNILFFTNKTALESFESWWTKYAARFPKDQVYSSTTPMPMEGQLMTGYPLMHDTRKFKHLSLSAIQKTHLDQWHWLAENTTEPVLFTKDFWLFASEAEMVMFKLRDKRLGDEDDEDGESYNGNFEYF